MAETGAVRVEGKGIVNTGGASGLGLATVETRIAVVDPVKEVLRMRARDLA